jgi:hypothetical protein
MAALWWVPPAQYFVAAIECYLHAQYFMAKVSVPSCTQCIAVPSTSMPSQCVQNLAHVLA